MANETGGRKEHFRREDKSRYEECIEGDDRVKDKDKRDERWGKKKGGNGKNKT